MSERIFTKKFDFILISIFFFLVYFPEIYTLLSDPDGLLFNGVFLNITDFNVYLSAIRQGAEGNWLFQPQFNPESIQPYFAFFPYILSGKVMSLVGGSSIIWFRVLKFFSLILALKNLGSLGTTVFPQQVQKQKTTFFMLLFSSGIGWLFLPFIGRLTPMTPDLFIPEWNLINNTFAPPHFLLGIAFQAAFFRALLILFESPAWKHTPRLTAAGIGLSLAYPYLIAVNGLVIAAYLIFRSIQARKVESQQIMLVGASCIPMIFTLIYYGYFLPQDPLYAQLIVTNNEIIPPHLAGIFIGFGFLVPLSAIGISNRWKNNTFKLLAFWLAANLIAIYLPFTFSGRLVIGLNIPIIFLAAAGLEEKVLPWIKSKTDNTISLLRTRSLVLTVPSTLFFILYFTIMINSYEIYPFYQNQSDMEAAAWLAEITTADDLILAEFPMCNLFPRFGKGRVFNGHFDLTDEMQGKFKLSEKFWNTSTSNQWREEFIKQWGFTYIYQGPAENAHSDGDPLNLPYEVIYQTEDSRIYRVP